MGPMVHGIFRSNCLHTIRSISQFLAPMFQMESFDPDPEARCSPRERIPLLGPLHLTPTPTIRVRSSKYCVTKSLSDTIFARPHPYWYQIGLIPGVDIYTIFTQHLPSLFDLLFPKPWHFLWNQFVMLFRETDKQTYSTSLTHCHLTEC